MWVLSKFHWGSEIGKLVTRHVCNVRRSEKDYTRPCRTGYLLSARFFDARTCEAICRTCGTRARENQLICVTAHRKLPWKRTGCAEGVLGRDVAEALSPLWLLLLLLSDRHVECWMHNNLLSHLRIHRPRLWAFFLVSFRLSLPKTRGVFSAPVDEKKSVSDPRAGIQQEWRFWAHIHVLLRLPDKWISPQIHLPQITKSPRSKAFVTKWM